MQDAGIIRGAYHFARPGSDAKTQADFFVDTVISAGGYNASRTMQLVLDLEAADDLSAAEVWAWVQTWTAQVKQRTGRPPIICESLVSLSANSILTLMHSCTSDFTRADTGYYFWNDSVGAPTDNLDSPLWIASYTSPAPVGIPTAWKSLGWAFWQYDDNGATVPGGSSSAVPGISGNVDVSYFQNSGNYPSLESLCFS